MNLVKLQEKDRLFYSIDDLSSILKIDPESARVFATRATNQGFLQRLKRNVYILKSKISSLSLEDYFQLSNIIQTPSYISLQTALSYYGITTQITRGIVEAIDPIRTAEFDADFILFSYRKMKSKLYFGFERTGPFFIAISEKALLDSIYFTSLQRYEMDFSSVNWNEFSLKKLNHLAKKFPRKTQMLLKQLIQKYD